MKRIGKTNISFNFHYDARQKSKYKYISKYKCISTNKLNSISCGICLSFKSRHLELFCKIIIQLSSTDIFLGLWSRGPPCNFTEQLFFLRSREWLASNHLINKCDQKIR